MKIKVQLWAKKKIPMRWGCVHTARVNCSCCLGVLILSRSFNPPENSTPPQITEVDCSWSMEPCSGHNNRNNQEQSTT